MSGIILDAFRSASNVKQIPFNNSIKLTNLIHRYKSGVPGLEDRVFAVHTRSLEFRLPPERFCPSSRTGHPHTVCSQLEEN